MRYTQLVGIGVVVVLSSGPAWAGQQLRLGPSDGGRRAAAAQEGEVRTARGQLVGVDATAQVLTIKGGDGNDLRFSYSDATKVTGELSISTVAGLSARAGTQLTVHFTTKGLQRMATQVDVVSARR